ncbi:ATP-binding cassette, subfamily B [Halolactibacillus halophilus]|uniref:ATP-binding cassette, subfamily B n=1 Tax=Halolactibacillus halophilus TaxID=306540 RepID=A0A1I5QIJ7_9BACI|nr:ABC transporter ATP-binding protein [Halolactibacillus halophilus]GEM01812.1 putative multidrug resistance ABC transporter ATP-binding/permease protein YheH [Halolactibacillus halophilus]SFP46053.1 ATP-binding cassette, subfamily B [Halolactibacillus halophilus]
MKASVEKRLLRYLFINKQTITFALIALIIAVALELTGPFIAKQVIDRHIVGVQTEWVAITDNNDNDTIELDNRYLKRSDRLDEDDVVINTLTFVQVNRAYYLAEGTVPVGETLTVTEDGQSLMSELENFQAEKLSAATAAEFFAPEVRPIMLWLALYLGLILIASVFQYLKTYLLQVHANKIIQTMRNDVFETVERLPMRYFVNMPAGKILARVTNDTEAIKELYVRVLETFVNGFIYMGGIMIALYLLNPTLATISLVLLPLLMLFMKFYKMYAGQYNDVIRAVNSDINASINESIQTMPIIQAFRRTNDRADEFEQLNDKHYRFQKKMVALSALASYNLVNVLRGIAFLSFIWFFGNQSLTGTMLVSTGLLYAFVDYLTRLFEPMTQMVNQLPQLEQARVSARRVFQLLDEDTEAIEDETLPRIKGDVRFDHVTFGYDKGETILNDLSFHVAPGETAAFVGHTGSGKSSVMNLLFRFYDPGKGKVLLDSVDTQTLTRQQTRTHMAIVLQDPFIFTGTVLSNITLNDPKISRDQAIAALKAVGADQFIEKLPRQYDEPVGENGNEFSTGQRQLLSFARALAFDPAILILDEATANIDSETEMMIQEAMNVLSKGRTMLVIAHRLSTIQHADQIIVLNKGEIIERGTHLSLLNEKGSYYQMYKMQQAGIDEVM